MYGKGGVKMTEKKTVIKSKKISVSTSVIIIFISVIFSSILSPKINEYTKDGLSLCFGAVIGSVFPFMILTDIIVSGARLERISLIRRLFEKAFKINGYAATAFLCGILCGFPLGVKVSSDLYKKGLITRQECERLIGFSNNTGPAFVISGIGVALRGSYKDGLILYFCMLLSSVIVGIIFGIGKTPSKINGDTTATRFELTASLKSASKNTLYICGYVTLFSVITGILSEIVKNKALLFAIIPFIEVSNATKLLSRSSLLPSGIALALSAFAISFSGLSVHLQAKSFLSDTDISMKKYYFMKFLQGLFAAFLCGMFSF